MRTSFLYTIGAIVVLGVLIALAIMALRHGVHGGHFVYVRPHGDE